MAINLQEATQAIRKAGSRNTRIVPMAGQPHDGSQQIEIMENGQWNPVATGLSLKMASDLVGQAVNRCIMG